MFGNILLMIVSMCTFISYLPQIIKLFRLKESEDISISSWILWVISYIAYALYAIFVSKDGMLIFTTLLELLFCLVILILSIVYRRKK